MNSRPLTVGIPLIFLLLSYLLGLDTRIASLIQMTPSGLHSLALFSNAFHPWQLDPITSLLFGSFPSEILLSHFYYLLLGLGLGMLVINRKSEDRLIFASALGSSLFVIHRLFGMDAITLGAICWIPWVCFAAKIHHPIGRKVVLAVTLLLFWRAAGFYALYLTPLLYLVIDLQEPSDRATFAITGLLGVLLLYLLTPDWSLPHYPTNGHLVPDDGVPGRIIPLTNAFPPVDILNRIGIKSTLRLPVALVSLFLSLSLVLDFKKVTNRTLGVAFVITCLSADILLPEQYALIAPLETARRIIPNAFGYPGSLALLAGLILVCGSSFKPRIALLIGLALTASTLALYGRTIGGLTDPHAARLASTALAQSVATRQRIVSPSFIVYLQYRLRADAVPRETSNAFATIHSKDVAHLELSDGSLVRKKRYRDKNRKTRIRVGPGKQEGNEWFCIELRPGLQMQSVRLDTGQFFTDFPRALLVKEGESCSTIDHLARRAARYTPWEGPLRFTDHGYPYFGPQSDVELDTPSHPRALFVKQLGHSNFNWSIAEIEVAYVEPPQSELTYQEWETMQAAPLSTNPSN